MFGLKVFKLNPLAKDLTRGSAGSIGSDISCIPNPEREDGAWIVPACGRVAISTGIAVNFPASFYMRVAPRSGLAYKNGISVLAGVVDSDYEGEVKVILFNTTDTDFVIKPGDRIAQLIFERAEVPNSITYYDQENNLIYGATTANSSKRGEGGFGSTGR